MFRTLHGISSVGDCDRYRVTDAEARVCGYIEPYCPQRVLACDADGRLIVFTHTVAGALEAVIDHARHAGNQAAIS